MEQVVIYSSGCPSCADAEQIMRKLGAEPEIVDVQANPSLRDEVTKFLEMHGREASFPQVVIGNRLVGGLDRVKELEASGKLPQMLTQKKGGACCRGLPDDQCNDMHRGMGKEKAHDHEHKAHEEEKEHVH